MTQIQSDSSQAWRHALRSSVCILQRYTTRLPSSLSFYRSLSPNDASESLWLVEWWSSLEIIQTLTVGFHLNNNPPPPFAVPLRSDWANWQDGWIQDVASVRGSAASNHSFLSSYVSPASSSLPLVNVTPAWLFASYWGFFNVTANSPRAHFTRACMGSAHRHIWNNWSEHSMKPVTVTFQPPKNWCINPPPPPPHRYLTDRLIRGSKWNTAPANPSIMVHFPARPTY